MLNSKKTQRPNSKKASSTHLNTLILSLLFLLGTCITWTYGAKTADAQAFYDQTLMPGGLPATSPSQIAAYNTAAEMEKLINTRITEISGRQRDGSYGGEGTGSSVYARVLHQTNQNTEAAKEAAYAAELKMAPLIRAEEQANAAASVLVGKTTAQINASPELKKIALDYETARKATLQARNEIDAEYKIGTAETTAQRDAEINKPEGSFISEWDARSASIAASEAEARRIANTEPIYCLQDINGDSLGIPEFSAQGCIALGLYYGLLKPSSWVLWASGVAFNYSIDFTLNFGKFIRDQGLGTSGSGAIYLGWSAIRDLINVGFIFILLYAGIATILDLGGYGVKQTVIKVVIAALLLNFSLFFTKALIDMSNLVALQFYTRVLSAADQANSGSSLTLAGESQPGKGWDSGLSVGFINALGLKSIWVSKDNQSGNQATSAFGTISAGQMIIICLGGSAFILVTAFVLFMATIRFLYRSIVLIFLMILSPIGFVGDAIPQLAGPAKKWRGRLGNNLMFAPAYMAIFYVVALIVFGKNIGPSQVATNSGAGLTGFGALFKGDVSSAGLMFWFVMIIGLMIGTQIAADSFADKLDMADSFKKKAKGWAASFGNSAKGGFGLASAGSEAAGYAGRRAVGNTGIALSQNKLVQKLLVGTPLKNVGGQALYNKIGDLKDKKVGGYSLSDAKKAKEAKDEKTRDRLSEVSKPRTDEEKKAYEIRKGLEEVAARRAHLDQLGIAHSYHEEEQDADGKVTKVGKIFVGAEGTYKKDDTVGNQKAEKEEYDRADFEAKKIGGVIGSSMQAAIKKARTGNKGTVKGIEDQIDALAKEIVEMEHPAFVHIRSGLEADKEAAEKAYETAAAASASKAVKDAAAQKVMAAMAKLTKHTQQLNDKIRRKEQLEKDKAIANSRATS